MALCRTCHTVIPCHCHLAPAREIRPGVYVTKELYPVKTTDHVNRHHKEN